MKFNKGTIAATLTLTMLVAGAVGTTAFAANADNSALQSAAVTQQTQTNDVQTTETENSTDAAALAAQAKITEADAIAAAEAANSGYSFTVDELGSENGALVYELKGTDSNGNKLKALIDATDGSIVTQAADAENGGDTNDENGDNENSQNQADLAAQAKITEADAIAAAEAANSGYSFIVDELGSENGALVYELKGTDSNGNKLKALIDATDGSIVTQAADAENGGDTNDENGDNENSQNQADLAAQAKITEADAIAAAEAVNSGYTFTVNKLDSENSVVTYELKGIDGNGSEIEVQVNAVDGSIIQEAESD